MQANLTGIGNLPCLVSAVPTSLYFGTILVKYTKMQKKNTEVRSIVFAMQTFGASLTK